MPLVIMCGLPCSGKTQRVEQLVQFIKDNYDKEVQVHGRPEYARYDAIDLPPPSSSMRYLCSLNASVQVVRDDFSAVSKNECYVSSREEKTMRAALKSHVERHLNSGMPTPRPVRGAPAWLHCSVYQPAL